MDGEEVMTEFVSSLKESYRERQLMCEEQWPPVRGDKLINLQLVETDKAEGFRGGAEKTKRTLIAYGDLFKAEDGKKPVRKIIVEGNGGMGKTTLCTMFAEGWAEEIILKEFDCVLLLPLRDEQVSSAESLSDLFKLLHDSEAVCSAVIDNIQRRRGKGVLIIADGWDELEEAKRSKKSYLHKFLFGHSLRSASVLLTSRPSASAPLHSLPSVDRLVEVVGFNEENVKEYIHSEFSERPEKACSLIEQLDSNPLVLNVCSVPLNCAITCYLWHTLDQVLPSTLTELYTQIVQNIAFRNMKKKFPNTSLGLSLNSFDSIPEHLQKSFKLTCKFAFESLLKDKIVFSENELASFFPEVLESNENFLCFGLLQSALSLLPVGQGLSFHFLHLTIQEFLAAFHFVTLPSEEQQKIFKKHAESHRFANVWKFAFGLGSKTQGSSSGRVSRNVVCLENKVVDGFVSALSKEDDRLLLCHCALESKDDVVTTKVARQINGQFDFYGSMARTPHDCVAVYHVLRQTSHGSTVCISLSGCGLDDKQLRELTDILSSGELKVKKLLLSENKLNSNSATNLFAKASSSFSSLNQLWLHSNRIDGDCVNSIVTSLMHISCNSLTDLSLSDNPLGVSGIQALERAAQAGVLVNLGNLNLSNTLTSDMDINGALLATFTKSIASHCPRLSWLVLSENRLGVPGACAMGEALPLLTKGINKLLPLNLSLSKTKLNSEAVVAFSDSVVNNSKLISKELQKHSRVCLSPQISSSPSPQFGKCTLYLDNNPLGSDGVLAIFRMLGSETCQINELYLDNTDLTTTDSQCQTIQHTNTGELLNLGPVVENSCLVYLDLDNNNFNGERVHALVDFIRVCQSLEHLSCRNSQLSLVYLLRLLKSSGSSSSNLEKWDLSGNSLHDDEINALIANVPDLFPNLEKVSVYDNPVSDEVKKSLEKCLKRNKKGIGTYTHAWFARRERQEAELAKERSEREARRCLVLTEWERTCSPPQSEELLSEFLRMWDELLWDMCYYAHVIVRYPGLYGLTTEVKGQDESQSLEMSDQPTVSVESLLKDDQQTDSIEEPTDCPPVKKMRVSVSPPTRPTGKHQHDENTDSNCPSPPLKKARLSPDCSLSFLPPTPALTSTDESGSTDPTVESTHIVKQEGAEKSIPELSLRVLTVELRHLTKPIEFGIHLKIPQSTLEIIKQDHRLDTNGQKIALFEFIANNNESLGITWSSISDALLDIHAGNLSLSIREKYCSAVHVKTQSNDASEPSSLSVTTDFQLVYEALYPACPNWYNIGLALKLSPPTLGLIEIDNQDYHSRSLRDILLTRMKMVPMLTWREIVEALRLPSVGERKLALSIERQYGARHGGSEGAQPQSMSSTENVPSPPTDKSQQDQTASDLSLGVVIVKIGTPAKPMTFSALSGTSREKYINIEHDFPGIEVIAQTYVVVTNSPNTFEWEGHGFSVDIPANSLSEGLDRCVIGIYASVSGQYELPGNHELVSAVYWVRPEPFCNFKQQLTVKVQHCAEKSYSRNLSFVRANCAQETRPYTFKKIEGSGTFTAESSYGSIQLDHFSGFGVTAEGPVERLYTAGLYYLDNKDVRSWDIHLVVTWVIHLVVTWVIHLVVTWVIHLVVTWDTKTHNSAVQKYYEEQKQEVHVTTGPFFAIEFENKVIKLDVPEDGVTTSGWTVKSIVPQLKKEQVDLFGEGSKPPCLQLKATYPKQEDKPQGLFHRLRLNGAKEPSNFITIYIDPSLSQLPQPKGMGEVSQKYFITWNHWSLEKCYLKYPTDFNSIYEYLWPVRAKWKDLGLSLGVLITTLDVIDKNNRGDCDDCLKNTLQSWMSTATQRDIEDLLKALSAPSVGFSELAKTLREKYCRAVHGGSN